MGSLPIIHCASWTILKSVDRTMLNKCRLLYLLAVVKSYLSSDTLPKSALKTRFCSTHASTLTEITDSVKKESKTFVFDSFCMFLPIFEGNFKVN